MAENYLVYSSAALFAMGFLSLIISFIFRWKSRKVNSFAGDMKQTVFDKTFVVFNPYQDRTKLIHRLLSFIPWIAMFGSFGFALLAFLLIGSGLLLTLVVTIVSLNLVILEEAAEAYQYSNLLIKAAKRGTDLGIGDLRLFKETKHVLPKLSNYYLALTGLFLALAISIQMIWSYAATSILLYSSMLLNAGSYFGAIGPIIAIAVLALTVLFIQIFAQRAKNKYFQTSIET